MPTLLSPWKLNDHLAQLHVDRFTAQIDLRRPMDGVVATAPNTCLGLQLLGVDCPLFAPGVGAVPAEVYLHERDLTVTYRESVHWPVQVDVTWRTVPAAIAETVGPILELVVSVRTQQLYSRPELIVGSRLPAGERLQPGAAELSGCFLVRFAEGQSTYVEMAWPRDGHSESRRDPAAPALLRIEHRLFPQSLEKGVILRSRLRGAVVPRADDVQIARLLYQEFAASQLPLQA